MNDLVLRLEVVSRSYQPLRDIRRWISRKPSEFIPKDHQQEMAYGLSNGHVTDNNKNIEDIQRRHLANTITLQFIICLLYTSDAADE